jgi:general stress protein YciG
MANKKPLTINEVARRGGLSTLKKHGRKKMREWGKLGGRPPKKGR